jgi:hypothetical protein
MGGVNFVDEFFFEKVVLLMNVIYRLSAIQLRSIAMYKTVIIFGTRADT